MSPLRPAVRAVLATAFVALLALPASLHGADSARIMALSPHVPPAGEPLNVVVIIADDLGWGDISCQGSAVPNITPNIDALATRGVRFTNGYAPAAQCSPSRAGMLTGRYPGRLHITTWIGSNEYTMDGYNIPVQQSFMNLEEVTLPEALKPLGYRSEQLGKWHIGDETETYGPIPQGFDEEHGYCPGASPPTWFPPYKNLSNLPPKAGDEYITDRLAMEAVDFIDRYQNQPFLVYLQNYGVHANHVAKSTDITDFVSRGYSNADDDAHNSAQYLAQLKSVDDGVGLILAKIDALGLTNRTLIVFISDNGATKTGSNDPLFGWKKWGTEGGIRVPFIMAYPPLIPANTLNHTPVNGIDLMPTILDLAGLPRSQWPAVDGTSLRPLFTTPSHFGRDQVYWHFPQIVADGQGKIYPYGIIREGPLKYIRYYTTKTYPGGPTRADALFDLDADLDEQTNLAPSRPADIARFRALLDAHLAETNAQLVTPK